MCPQNVQQLVTKQDKQYVANINKNTYVTSFGKPATFPQNKYLETRKLFTV